MIRAATIGARNSVEVTGAPWRHWRDHAPELGVQLYRAGRKQFLIVEELLTALQRRRVGLPANEEVPHASLPTNVDDAAEGIRRLLGKRLKAGGR